MVHRDLHPGNILSDQVISDFGFCGPADKILNNIYGRLGYVAPEFTDAFGILDLPNIIGLPSTYECMMKKCLDPNSEQRPDAQELFGFF
ncbi:kinase-like domain-containing protein [Gigaspora margarita]|uniref:Kinase-like domain-containing protein n=1 Tax=Gigaspora margarita TaxID=4874 RepID=A0A8H4B1D3_GIGMA|nr:kinase-like domain-containing protein [Gigaspora margarita]